jgi:1-acyl-sn-glycerol-3-phosphate acyltransferase
VSSNALIGPTAVPRPSPTLPTRSPRLIAWFTRYSRWYVGRHFHSVRLAGAEPPPLDPAQPLVVCVNHASWWDPLLCLLASDCCFPGRAGFAPIDAVMLQRYRFFARLGFFGVEQQSTRGAARFLRTAEAILRQPNTALWLTPEGRFTDPRQRPVSFKPGLGHLAARLTRATLVPLAVELTFWEERTPEALLLFGQPVEVVPGEVRTADEWTTLLERRLEAALDSLARLAQQREPAAFTTLLRGGAGVGGVYDLWRRGRAWLRGESFNPSHGDR